MVLSCSEALCFSVSLVSGADQRVCLGFCRSLLDFCPCCCCWFCRFCCRFWYRFCGPCSRSLFWAPAPSLHSWDPGRLRFICRCWYICRCWFIGRCWFMNRCWPIWRGGCMGRGWLSPPCAMPSALGSIAMPCLICPCTAASKDCVCTIAINCCCCCAIWAVRPCPPRPASTTPRNLVTHRPTPQSTLIHPPSRYQPHQQVTEDQSLALSCTSWTLKAKGMWPQAALHQEDKTQNSKVEARQ